MGLRIALLNASYSAVDTRRNFRREVDADLVEYHAPSGEIPETFGFDACVVTGSRASVYWDEPWIGDLRQWVSKAVERGLPTLGVCFGHQLLAAALGGRVEEMAEPELGYRTVRCRDDTTLLAGVDREFTAFTTHSDRVSQLPPEATVLADNDYGLQGFRRGDAFGVQFHPEYDTDTARQVAEMYRGDQRDADKRRVERVLEGIGPETYRDACKTKTLFDNFTRHVRRRSDIVCD